jgi:hypothetical protein
MEKSCGEAPSFVTAKVTGPDGTSMSPGSMNRSPRVTATGVAAAVAVVPPPSSSLAET